MNPQQQQQVTQPTINGMTLEEYALHQYKEKVKQQMGGGNNSLIKTEDNEQQQQQQLMGMNNATGESGA